jgi:hypothetical protein
LIFIYCNVSIFLSTTTREKRLNHNKRKHHPGDAKRSKKRAEHKLEKREQARQRNANNAYAGIPPQQLHKR